MGRLDRYTVQARLFPALIVALPIALASVAIVGAPAWAAVAGIATWAGGTALLAQIARDGGKRKEPALFESWGGMPTVARLRHRDAANPITLSRWHAKLKNAMKNAKLPTAQQEAADPDGADAVYEACGTLLRGHTRDEKKFPLVFAENCNYGFRRNLWGMKPIGIGVALASLVAMLGLLAVDASAGRGAQFAAALLGSGVDISLLAGWLFVFKPAWVRTPAEAYADRLLEACETL